MIVSWVRNIQTANVKPFAAAHADNDHTEKITNQQQQMQTLTNWMGHYFYSSRVKWVNKRTMKIACKRAPDHCPFESPHDYWLLAIDLWFNGSFQLFSHNNHCVRISRTILRRQHFFPLESTKHISLLHLFQSFCICCFFSSHYIF